MRWLIVFTFAFIVFNGLREVLAKLGLGRVPGDFSFRFAGREWFFPFGSSVLISLLTMVVARWL
ncbi:hypothetical protein C7444_10114 [Sphaerotilus hippei]|uniref:DUF2905 family protein n=1 Tax=Sphaerotilus hippei TaxID=744406 RepID=A0A318H575_9BURK|nr:DUF2905 domain-containing protein [Sphaerotilus hippei]PXW99186.1 hypothetical protein C7444_10114 [Sphaerotilus hippei]